MHRIDCRSARRASSPRQRGGTTGGLVVSLRAVVTRTGWVASRNRGTVSRRGEGRGTSLTLLRRESARRIAAPAAESTRMLESGSGTAGAATTAGAGCCATTGFGAGAVTGVACTAEFLVASAITDAPMSTTSAAMPAGSSHFRFAGAVWGSAP